MYDPGDVNDNYDPSVILSCELEGVQTRIAAEHLHILSFRLPFRGLSRVTNLPANENAKHD